MFAIIASALWMVALPAAVSSELVDSRLMSGKTKQASSNPLPQTRIVGGKEVKDSDEFPFFVNLASCSGSLIHGDIVLTAAHVSDRGERLLVAFFGYPESYLVSIYLLFIVE